MPDDDYEEVRVGYECYDIPQTPACECEHCYKVNAKMENTKQINALLDFIDGHITMVRGDNFEVYAAVKNITKVLRLMNGI